MTRFNNKYSDADTPHLELFENNILGLLTVDQLADALGKAPNTIRNWVSRREIPFVRVGNVTKFKLESIEAWLKEMEYNPWQ